MDDNIQLAIALIDGLMTTRLRTELCASVHIVDSLLDIRQLLLAYPCVPGNNVILDGAELISDVSVVPLPSATVITA